MLPTFSRVLVFPVYQPSVQIRFASPPGQVKITLQSAKTNRFIFVPLAYAIESQQDYPIDLSFHLFSQMLHESGIVQISPTNTS
jgi:hypothetical protein